MSAGKIKDYYKILGVGKNADKKEIKSAYRKLARKYHPDANPNDKAAEDRFKEASEAYEILGHAEKRAEYDRQREYFAAGGAGMGGWRTTTGGAPGAGGFQDIFTGGAEAGYGSIFEDLLGGRGRAAQRPVSGDDLYYTITLGFKEAFSGTTKKVRINRRRNCSTCGGTGAKPGSRITTCETCGGRGVVAQNQGFFSLSQTCPTCGGEGTVVKERCRACGGAGTLPEEKTITVNIPAGMHSGSKLKYKGLGQAGHRGAPSGDLYIIVQVKEHAFFKRAGANVHVDLPIKYTEAALGATIKTPTATGSVSLKIPPGTQNGQTFRVKGKGFPKPRGAGEGDMLVKVHIEVPAELTPEQRDLLAKVAAVMPDDPREKIRELAGSE